MKSVQISLKTAQKLYPKASEEFKALLEENFSKSELSTKITDRIKSYEDACEETGETPIDEQALLKAGLLKHEIVGRKLATITRALNQDWVLDWANENQKKWLPWFRMASSRFAFGVTIYLCALALAGYASRLCFKSEELARYAGETFTDLYNDYLLGQ